MVAGTLQQKYVTIRAFPKEASMHTMKRILVVSRMTKYSTNAVHCGISLARQAGAELYVLHITENPGRCGQGWNLSAPSLMPEDGYNKMLQKKKEELDAIINAERSNGKPVIELFRTGDAGEVILQILAEKDIDLIIMAAHEEGRLEQILFGYSKEKIIRRMPCSILLVKTEPAVLGAEY